MSNGPSLKTCSSQNKLILQTSRAYAITSCLRPFALTGPFTLKFHLK